MPVLRHQLRQIVDDQLARWSDELQPRRNKAGLNRCDVRFRPDSDEQLIDKRFGGSDYVVDFGCSIEFRQAVGPRGT